MPDCGGGVESMEARLSRRSKGKDAGPQASWQGASAAEKRAPEKASPRLCPAADGTRPPDGARCGVLPGMPHHPVRGMGAADPGSHRYSGGPSGSHRARLHGPAVSAVPETAATPGPPAGLAVGRQRLGVNLVSLIVTLREEGRLPVRTIQWYLRTFHQLKLSVGAIVRGRPSGCPAWRNGCR